MTFILRTFSLHSSLSVLARALSVQSAYKMLPFFVKGKIVKGFGRGSKDLGFPTANFPDDVTKNLPEDLQCGVYCGYANVDDGEVYKMVMSIGYNPFYKNKQKSMETHVMHSFDKDLYDSVLKVCILHHLRPETDFRSLDDLIEAIKGDIRKAEEILEKADHRSYKDNPFFHQES